MQMLDELVSLTGEESCRWMRDSVKRPFGMPLVDGDFPDYGDYEVAHCKQSDHVADAQLCQCDTSDDRWCSTMDSCALGLYQLCQLDVFAHLRVLCSYTRVVESHE
jgi:hypothetical protein